MGSCFMITHPGPGNDVIKEEQSPCRLLERVVTISFAEVSYQNVDRRSINTKGCVGGNFGNFAFVSIDVSQ